MQTPSIRTLQRRKRLKKQLELLELHIQLIETQVQYVDKIPDIIFIQTNLNKIRQIIKELS